MERTQPPKGKPQNPTGNITLSKALRDKMFDTKNGDSLILYLFYRHTADWQRTDQVKADDKYCMNGLGWGYDRFKKAKDLLISISLICPISKHNKQGHFTDWFIKVYHVWEGEITHNTENPVIVENRKNAKRNLKKPQTENTFMGEKTTQTSEKSPQLLKPSTGESETNTLKTNKSVFNYFISLFPEEWQNNVQFKKAILTYVKHRNNKKNKLTSHAIKLLANDFKIQSNAQTVIDAINKTIMNGWTGVFFNNNISSKLKCPHKNWIFGKDYNSAKQGCNDCEESNSRLYYECKLTNNSLKKAM